VIDVLACAAGKPFSEQEDWQACAENAQSLRAGLWPARRGWVKGYSNPDLAL
jgi:hypothetical protein